MKLTRTQAEGVIQVIKEVLRNNRYADKALEHYFKINRTLTLQDKAFIAQTSYAVIRFYRMLITVSQSESLWKILGAWAVLNQYELNEWKEFSGMNTVLITERFREIQTDRKIRESVPDWLDEWGMRELGDRWEPELQALNTSPQTFLRTNTVKITRNDLHLRLKDEGIESHAVPDYPDALRVTHAELLFQSSSFQEGLFEVQDAGSQAIAPFLQVKPGMRVIDACAGSGGKTLHLASLMQNKGRLIALDVAGWRLENFRNRARRAGVHNFETQVIETPKVIKRLHHTADRLLLDVPCSGLGVLRRNPDAKWKLQPEYIHQLITEQQNILQRYSRMVKPGGQMVYATCSILPSENQHQVEKFLQEHHNSFALEEEKTLWPSSGFDGFYMALLKRLS
jgi:16S rRNA (cytosine967-C5)-methyltransferase